MRGPRIHRVGAVRGEPRFDFDRPLCRAPCRPLCRGPPQAAVDIKGNTPLHRCAALGRVEMLADIGYAFGLGLTSGTAPLHPAIWRRNAAGESALDVARRRHLETEGKCVVKIGGVVQLSKEQRLYLNLRRFLAAEVRAVPHHTMPRRTCAVPHAILMRRLAAWQWPLGGRRTRCGALLLNVRVRPCEAARWRR